MKLVKIFGAVMVVHAAVFMFVFAIPGCRSTGKKPAASASVADAGTSPLGAPSDSLSPIGSMPAPAADVSGIRFSPTRPGTSVAVGATAPETHTVVKGDNLWSIAKKHGLTVKELTAANKLRADSTLQLGQKLVLPGKSAAYSASVSAADVAPAAPTAPAAASTFSHVVKAGETLGGIAKKYQTKVGDIATANNIADPTKIRVGQTLKIPGWQSASSAKPALASPAKPAAPAVAVPARATAPVAPLSPSFVSPFEATTSAPATESPFITPTTPIDAPLIRVEESGAPRIE